MEILQGRIYESAQQCLIGLTLTLGSKYVLYGLKVQTIYTRIVPGLGRDRLEESQHPRWSHCQGWGSCLERRLPVLRISGPNDPTEGRPNPGLDAGTAPSRTQTGSVRSQVVARQSVARLRRQ